MVTISKKMKKSKMSKKTKKGKMVSVKKSKVRGSCNVMKKLTPSSDKFLETHKTLLVCADNKCKEFLDKDIKISETCLDKTVGMKFNDPKRIKIEDTCYKKMGLLPNTMDKLNCINKKCSTEMKNFQKFPFSEHNVDAIHDFSDFEREKYRVQQKREKAFPVLKEITKLNNKRRLIEEAHNNCKNEKEKKNLKMKMDKLDSQIAALYIK
jgi:hypothetical protein